MADPTPEEEKLNAYRDLLNRRAVSRSDPAVTEILETCTFVSLWIFDTVVEEWRKQKQEGALFLLKRWVSNCLYGSCYLTVQIHGSRARALSAQSRRREKHLLVAPTAGGQIDGTERWNDGDSASG